MLRCIVQPWTTQRLHKCRLNNLAGPRNRHANRSLGIGRGLGHDVAQLRGGGVAGGGVALCDIVRIVLYISVHFEYLAQGEGDGGQRCSGCRVRGGRWGGHDDAAESAGSGRVGSWYTALFWII